MTGPLIEPLQSPADHRPVEDLVYDRLALTLLAARHGLQDAAAAVRQSEANRMTLLYVHAITAAVTAPLFAWYGAVTGLPGPSWTVVHKVPGSWIVMAAVLAVGGMVLGFGTTSRHRRSAMIGLSLIMVWYGTMTATFLTATGLWLAAGADPARMPAIYAASVYIHPAIVMFIHLRTIVRMIRSLTGVT